MQRILSPSRLPSLRSAFLPSFRAFSSSPAASSSDASPVASTSSAPSPAAPETSPAPAEAGPAYFIPRSRFGELPVYADIRNGGARHLTVVRKVQGDLDAFRRDLASFLSGATTSYLKPHSQQLVIKGDWVRETKEFLAARGF
ncbi:hypothetical protein JCM1841_001012 [Sporobolomyces salmonicolor]